MINCNECKHINLTEEMQNILGDGKLHACNLYEARLLHGSVYPKIVPCGTCGGRSFEKRDVRELFTELDDNFLIYVREDKVVCLYSKHNDRTLFIPKETARKLREELRGI